MVARLVASPGMRNGTDRQAVLARVRDVLATSPGWTPPAPEPEPPDRHEPAAAEGGASPTGELPHRVVRLRISAHGRAALFCVALVAVLVSAFVWWQSRPEPAVGVVTVLAGPAASGATPGSAASARGAGARSSIATIDGVPSGPSPGAGAVAALVIDVAGKVHRPGLVRLPAGSRVADAIAAAGGLLPGVDVSSVNRARVVTDGEQVVVGVEGAPLAAGKGTAAPGGTVVLDLNAATAEQLDTLPGVGPVMAAKILSWRAEHGHFATVDELKDVPGIGERKFASLSPRLRV